MEFNISIIIFFWICFLFLTLLGISLAFFYKKLSNSKSKYSKEFKEISIKQVSYSVYGAQPTAPLVSFGVLIIGIFLPISLIDFIIIIIPFILIQMIFLKIKKILIASYKEK